MTWHFPHYIIAYIISAISSTLLVIFAWRRRSTPAAASFAFLMLAVVDWTLFSIPEISLVQTWAKVFWAKFAYPGIASSGLLWLLFAARFSRYDAWITKKRLALLWVIPSITLLLVFTSRWHHLYYTEITPIMMGDTYALIYHRGPLFWLHVAFTYSTLLAGSFLLIKGIVRFPKIYRRQITPILLSSLFPWAANIIYILRIRPFTGIDLTPISFAVCGLLFYWSLFRGRIFDITPMARDILMDQMSDGIVVLDDKNRVIDVNPATRALFRNVKSPIGKDGQKAFPLLAPHIGSDYVTQGEVDVGDDPPRTLMFVVSPLNDRYGDISGRLVVLRDVSERKRTEEALRQSEEKFRTLFNTSRDFIYIADTEGNIIDANQATLESLGYCPEELSQLKAHDLYANPEDEQALMRLTAECGYVVNHETRLRKKDGETIETLMTVIVRVDEAGNPIGFYGSARDITERRKTELQLLQAEKLFAVGTMISGAAHELNNPLTSIVGNAQLLMRQDVPVDVKNKLAVIEREAVRSSKIVYGLLTFARERKPGRCMTDINDVVVESLKLHEHDLTTGGIDVRLSLAGDLPSTAVDPFQLQQVLINLINNARDALRGREGGTLTVSTYERNGFLVIAVEDSGPGIADEHIKKIFDPFFTTKEIGQGTGLGLSTAYGIIREHGGTITAESKPGKGAAFFVTIPIVTCVP
jgi:PAS domain S-box-containing protein